MTIGADMNETAQTTSDQYDSDYFAGAKGVAITVAAGDNGYQPPGSPLGYPAASQYVTAVGGTTLTQSGTGTCTASLAGVRGWCESVWNGLSATTPTGATESGCSLYDPQPAWQAAVAGDGCGSLRASVDVAADADPDTGVAVYDSGQAGWLPPVGGTAVAAAIVAGVYALAGTPQSGTYPAAYPYQHPGALHDITTGGNLAPGQAACTPDYLCTAQAGYDAPSGLGSPEGTLSFTATGSSKGAVYSGITNKCLDDYQDLATNNNKVEIWTCNGNNSQTWTTEADGTIRINGMCLDVTGAGTANGTKVELYTCHGTGNQQWQPTADAALVNPESGKCLDDPGSSTTNGTQLQIYTCKNTPSQSWTLPYRQPTGLDRVLSDYPSSTPLCVDDYKYSSTSGNKIDIWNCNDSGSQAWTVQGDGTIQINGECMHVHGDSATDGTKIELSSCGGGTYQQWRAMSDGSIVSLAAGSCLDEGSTATEGTQLVIRTCNQDAAQTWRIVPYQNNY